MPKDNNGTSETKTEAASGKSKPKTEAAIRAEIEAEQKVKAARTAAQKRLVDKLGFRKETRMVMRDVVVGRTDHGPLVDRKEVEESFEYYGSSLTYEEAVQLEGVLWSRLTDNQWTARVEGTQGLRRFVIDDETYYQLYPQEKPEGTAVGE